MLFVVVMLAALGALLIYAGLSNQTPQAVIKNITGKA